MNLQQTLLAIQESAVGEWMRYTPRAMPVVEATHVLVACMLFGALLVVDLRLLGFYQRQGFRAVSRQLLPVAWGAFGVALLTGALMFSTSAQAYFANLAFRFKMAALLGAGLNLAWFQVASLRNVSAWDTGSPPRAARMAGAISLLLWAAVVLLGRWTGFTRGYDPGIPPGMDFDFTS